MGSEDTTPKVPDDRVEELVQLIKDATTTKSFSLSINLDRTPALTTTKLGGVPYWPSNMAYPETSRGQKLMLLAQLDLADFQGCDALPRQGLLQFFVDPDDDCSGMDFDDGTNQNGFRVVWHREVDSDVTEDAVSELDIPTSACSWDDFLGNPLRGTYVLDVQESTSFMGPEVEGFNEVFLDCSQRLLGNAYVQNRDDWYDCLTDEGSDKLFDLLAKRGPLHQVLGYPFFTQTDPRYAGELADLDTLVLQVDSDASSGEDRVLWGDCGVGGFFMNGEALRRGDFSRVLFNWDCY